MKLTSPQKADSDLIKRHARENLTFNSLWLTRNRPLTKIQKVGFSLISGSIVLLGVISEVDLYQAGNVGGRPVFVLVGVAILPAIYIGIRGVLRVVSSVRNND